MTDIDFQFKPNDIVKSCNYLEKGLCFQLWGLQSCCQVDSSPVLVSKEEITEGKLSYDLIVQRRKELFLGINNKKDINIGGCKDCIKLVEKKFKDVCFDYLGGEQLPNGFNIQHYTTCNEKCIYCPYAQENNFKSPQYDIVPILDLFKKEGKLRGFNWIDFSGGEPTLTKELENILNYIMKNNLGVVVVYSNAVKFSNLIYEGLKKNKIVLTTSLDTGIKSKYAQIKNSDTYDKVLENLMKYRNSGTKRLWLKYVINDYNKTEDDMWSFIMTMLALRPNRIFISPEFPYNKDVPYDTVQFAAKLWYLLQLYCGDIVDDGVSTQGCTRIAKYHKELEKELNILKTKEPIDKAMQLRQFKQNKNMILCILKKINKIVPDCRFCNKLRQFAYKILVSWGVY